MDVTELAVCINNTSIYIIYNIKCGCNFNTNIYAYKFKNPSIYDVFNIKYICHFNTYISVHNSRKFFNVC